MILRRLPSFVVAVLVLSLSPPMAFAASEERKPAEFDLRKQSPALCAAIRGNGELVMAHFNSLAHVTEHYGVFDGLAGGSSGSISAFIYESIAQNPVVRDCAGCTEAEVSLRVSLLLKSLWAYLEILGESNEANSLKGFAAAAKRVVAAIKSSSPLRELKFADIGEAQSRLGEVLGAKEIRDFVNPELLSAVVQPALFGLKRFQLAEAKRAVQTFGKFEAEDPRIFFRPALVSFDQLSRDIGRIANFYGGRGGSIYPYAEMKTWLDHCAPDSLDLGWKDFSAKRADCKATIKSLIKNYNGKLADATRDHDIADSRLADPVGKYAHVLVSTMVLEPADATLFQKSLKQYQEGEEAFAKVKFKPYDRLKAGYWGHADDLKKLLENAQGYTDLRTQRRKSLGEASWGEVLSRSPAEPGLSRFREIPSAEGGKLVSAGGWSDLAPVLALKNIGCGRVVYITRRGEDSVFGRGIARNLGMTEAQDHALYDLQNPQSSLALSISQADGVWCTDWNAHPVTKDLPGLDRDSYAAPMELPLSKGPPNMGIPAGFPAYSRVTPATHLGCGGTVK